MVLNYKYKWNKKHTKISELEKNMQGIVFKEILCNDFDYIIVKYSTLNTIKYQVKIWMSGYYIPLNLCNNPRQAINFIKRHVKYVGVTYA